MMLSINFDLNQLKVPKQLTQKFSIFSKMWYFWGSCLGTLSWYECSSGIGFRCKTIKNVIDFYLFWFNLNLQRNCFIELSSELAAPILDRFKKNFGFCVFSIWSFDTFRARIGPLFLDHCHLESYTDLMFRSFSQ